MEVPEYDLPPGAIAQYPAEPRDSARLLDATSPSGGVEHRRVADLPVLLGEGDVVVVNTSRVVPARLRLRKPSGGAAEVLLLERDPAGGERCWKALVRPGRRLPPGSLLATASAAPAAMEVGERLDGGVRRVRFLAGEEEVTAACGEVALPPYVRKPLDDPGRYQTVYAERPGSVAAPTAGLHLTAGLLERCRSRGAEVAGLDLAIGLATFAPVAAERAEDHVMHPERYQVPPATWEACLRARERGGRVVAVGTTAVRALETAAATGSLEGASELFILGDYPFAAVDLLLTNFHTPRSSLLLLLEAFCGPRWRDLYREALAAGYRFLSLGDAMIVGRPA